MLPGFVDSHAHLVFAGDRAAEFAARMAGERYPGGGIRTTVGATRAASDEQLRANVSRLCARGAAAGHDHDGDQVRLRADRQRRGPIAADRRGSSPPETTFLGAHVVPADYADRPGDYVSLVCGPMLAAATAASAKWIDVFCEQGAFDEDHSRAILTVGAAAGLGVRVHANQLANGPGVRLAVELGAASADHCTHLSNWDIAALADSETVATLLPGAEFSTRSPYPPARPLLDAGATVALATDCNPGSSYTTSMPFCIALAVREMEFTPAEAVYAATPRRCGRAAADRHRPSHPRRASRPRRARRTVVPAPGLPAGRTARIVRRAQWGADLTTPTLPPITVTSAGVTPADVLAVARTGARVVIADDALESMQTSRAIVDAIERDGRPVYGVSTGFGALANTSIAPERRAELQHALIRSHAAGIGAPMPREVVRAMILLRVRSLALGRSGVRPLIAQALVDLLNADITPWVPEHGSLGASGDLAPLAHCALVLMGEGWVLGKDGARIPAAEAGVRADRAGLQRGSGLDQRYRRDAGHAAAGHRGRGAPVHHGRHHRRAVDRGDARLGTAVHARAARDPAAPGPGRVGRQHPPAAAAIRPSWTRIATT